MFASDLKPEVGSKLAEKRNTPHRGRWCGQTPLNPQRGISLYESDF